MTPATPQFLSRDEVLLLHELALREFGGSEGIRDEALLDSALAQPAQQFGGQHLHKFPFEMASAYLFHLVMNHPFVDGNKRTAWYAMRVFLFENGYLVRVPDVEAEQMVLSVVTGSIDKAALTAWLASRATKRPSIELREFFGGLDWPSLFGRMESLATSNWTPDYRAQVDEALPAMPVIADILRHGEENPQDNSVCLHFTWLLLALHRLAEDQRYEW